MSPEQIAAAGKAWAEREADARDVAPRGRWESLDLDALPLVDGLDPEQDRHEVAAMINAAAAAAWAALCKSLSLLVLAKAFRETYELGRRAGREEAS